MKLMSLIGRLAGACLVVCFGLSLTGCGKGDETGGGLSGYKGFSNPIAGYNPTESAGSHPALSELAEGDGNSLSAWPSSAWSKNLSSSFVATYSKLLVPFYGNPIDFGNNSINMETLGASLFVSDDYGSRSFGPGDFTEFDNKLFGLLIYEGYTNLLAPISTSGILTEAIMLGGGYQADNFYGLEYTDFGIWEARLVLDGGPSGIHTFSSSTGFVLADGSYKTAPASGELLVGTEFKGTVLANAYDNYNGKSISMVGDATLTVNPGTNAAGEIEFDLPDYIMNASLDITGGGISISSVFSVFNKPSAEIKLAAGGDSKLNGQFYGGTPNQATEAVGTFDYSKDNAGINGAFGVKK